MPALPFATDLSTDNFIVLLPGSFLGSDDMAPGMNYFRGVKGDLESRGCKVIEPKVSMTGSIKERAKQLDSQINDLLHLHSGSTTGKHDVHLIGQSSPILRTNPDVLSN
jgi:triacylglycerol lipase